MLELIFFLFYLKKEEEDKRRLDEFRSVEEWCVEDDKARSPISSTN